MSDTQKISEALSMERVKDLLRSGASGSGAAPGACPDEARYAGLLDGGISEEDRAELVGHLADCPQCTDLVACLVEIQEESSEQVPPGLIASALGVDRTANWWAKPSGRVLRPSFAVAAGLVLVAGLLVLQNPDMIDFGLSGVPSETPSSRPGGDVDAVRMPRREPESLAIELPSAGAVVETTRPEIRWSGVDESIFYEVQILSESGDVLWEGRTEETVLKLPAGSELERNQNYYVWVRARLPDGKSVKSKPVAIHIE